MGCWRAPHHGEDAKDSSFSNKWIFCKLIPTQTRRRGPAPPHHAAGGTETPLSRMTPDTHCDRFERHLRSCGNHSPKGSPEICLLQRAPGRHPESARPHRPSPSQSLTADGPARGGITLPQICRTERFQPNFETSTLTTPTQSEQPSAVLFQRGNRVFAQRLGVTPGRFSQLRRLQQNKM